jgi:translation initiation factor IF-2
MDNNKKIRLIQVAKEFKVGFNTLADFLQRKGLQSDCSPSSPVTAEVYALLEKEFGRNRQSGNERNAVRERIQSKGSVSINSQSEKETEEEEVVIKSNVISVKDEVRGPKILGKIDLDAKKKETAPAPKVEAKPAPAPAVEKKEEPKKESVAAPAPAPAITTPQNADNLPILFLI